MRSLFVHALLLLAACSKPEVEPATTCSDQGCPDGYTCDTASGRCLVEQTSPDAGGDATEAPPDAAPDGGGAMPDAPAAPVTAILLPEPGAITAARVEVVFSSSPPADAFTCRLDDGPATPCTSPTSSTA